MLDPDMWPQNCQGFEYPMPPMPCASLIVRAGREMDVSARKDHFSRAVVRAIAAAEGVKADVPEQDENSCDIEFAAPDTATGPGGRLTAQLKCSENVDPTGST